MRSTLAQHASVGSTEAANEVVARFGDLGPTRAVLLPRRRRRELSGNHKGAKGQQPGSNPFGATQEDCRTVSFERVLEIVNGLLETGGPVKRIVIHPHVSLQGTILYFRWLAVVSPSTPVSWQASVSVGH
jgi:hypothetical protein